ncbi:MAG: DUF1835 domain-containing protein [Phycisphaerales bacterium]|nr:DUF1835 domain-containing protein [Phycisphaerales bacterium]
MTHIVFSSGSAQTLKKVLQEDNSSEAQLVTLEDNLSYGYLQLDDNQDNLNRSYYYQEIVCNQVEHGSYETVQHDQEKIQQLQQLLDEDKTAELCIWVAQNKRDIIGYLALISKLTNCAGRLHLVFLYDLPFLNDKQALFYPTQLDEIPTREFLKAKKLARIISESEKEMDIEKWQLVVKENALLRDIQPGGHSLKKVISLPEDSYDKIILQFTPGECTVKVSKLIHTVLQQASAKNVAPFYLFWRIKKMVSQDLLTKQNGAWQDEWKIIEVQKRIL